jgi:hypothetical protein
MIDCKTKIPLLKILLRRLLQKKHCQDLVSLIDKQLFPFRDIDNHQANQAMKINILIIRIHCRRRFHIIIAHYLHSIEDPKRFLSKHL